jgi:hypothetical protein
MYDYIFVLKDSQPHLLNLDYTIAGLLFLQIPVIHFYIQQLLAKCSLLLFANSHYNSLMSTPKIAKDVTTAHVIPPQSCRIALRTHVQNHLAVLVHIVDATCWLSNQCHLPSVYSRVLKNHLQSVLMDMCIAVFQYRIPVPSLGQYRCRIEVKYKYITRNHLLSSTHCSLRLKC